MNLYEKQIDSELNHWHKEIMRNAGILERASKNIQKKTQQLVPRKAQDTITATVKNITHTIMFGSGILTINEDTSGLSLAERDYLVLNSFQRYRNTAVVQGAGFGAGGILLGLADLPVLMSIKIKFLFDCGKLYGFNPDEQLERLYMLNVFQLAFSSREHRLEVFESLENWAGETQKPLDWEKFQIEYRDYLDIAKLLQLLPVIGSIAGGTSNHKLMNQLKVNVMNCYRMRILGKKWTSKNKYKT